MISEVTIANNASESSELDLTSWQLVGLQMPDDWDAADLAVKARPGFSDDTKRYPNEILQAVYDSAGTEVIVKVDADRYVALTGNVLDALTGCGKVKFVSCTATASVAVNQSPARVILAVLAPID